MSDKTSNKTCDKKASELKPCPFCGGEAELVHWRNQNSWNTEYGIACTCGILLQGAEKTFTKEEAIEAWNTRKDCSGIIVQQEPFKDWLLKQ